MCNTQKFFVILFSIFFVVLALLSHSFNLNVGLLDLLRCEYLGLYLMRCSVSFLSVSVIVGAQLERRAIFPPCELHAYLDYY